ncbi:biotin--protein ligase isoform X1 [Drosophila busckii]|uniref:biotin--protein ligase isoform X1 n=1 Tax=Drosophila busckii TaxID=30019 RepID=UPI00083EE852|nr:biotin--protein ligase isoform X1 [Drosophila busckii]
MLTLYYVSATLVQSWRIQRTCKKITEQLAQSASIAFYTLQPGGEDGFDATFASSELCGNRNAAKVTDILWLHGNQRGCCLHPVQTLQITPWISFPAAPSWLPFAYASDTLSPVTTPTDNKLQPRVTLSTDSKQHLQLLLEARLEPQGDADSLETLAVRLEDYGKLIAWKVDSHLAVLIETDVQHFTQLLIMTFLQNNLCINDKLPLIRIESVLREGNPQPFELLTNHVKRQSRNSAEIGAESWQKHLEDLRALGVLAHQANEFEQQKQRTESKLGMRSMEQSPVGNTKAIAVVEPTTKATSPAKVTAIKPLPSELEKIAASKAKPKPAEDSNKPIAAPSTPAPRKTTPTKTFVAVAPTSPPPVSASQGASGSRPRPILRRNKDSLGESKPLNVLVYSDSSSARDSVINTLEQLLERDVYTVYALTPQEAVKKFWLEQTALLVVCGSVSTSVGQILVDYFLHGGKVLSLCSDILHFVLPNYRTAEVREHELVQFSYDKWQRVKMMHHIFCYQPSPVKKHFSSDSEESTVATHSRNPALVCPRSMEMKDLIGHNHKLDVQVLGSEETWNTPSIVLANSLQSGGKAIFSQVHLETSPSEFEFDEVKCSILKQNERTRLEIFAHLLRKYLDVDVQSTQTAAGAAPGAGIVYKQAYFLGRHESKFELLEKLGSRCSGSENVIVTPKLTLKFCGRDDKPPTASTNLLPILIHSCPDDFSTVDYFDCLKTEHIGRLVIYAPVISSSMNLINDLELMHGIVVLPLQQTAGMGRHNNQWLSPLGCAMFSTQLHISMDTPLAQRLPLLQHIIGAAIVNTLRSHPQYRVLDIALKWPNDIIANGNNKIGGLVVNTILQGSQAIVNIGSGINLNNSKPTVCINDVITQYNNRHPAANLPQLKYEQFMAFIFNEIERILAIVQNGHFDYFYNLYYDLWLHGEQSVRICLKNDEEKDATIVGIDDYGFLKVKLASGEIETVQPDGNSFDMLKGLIVPKYH